MLIAIEVFAGLLILGLIAVIILQRLGSKPPRSMKGDAVKTPEELAALAKANGEPKQISGKQELYEAIINQYIK